jgi:hypothetical protein
LAIGVIDQRMKKGGSGEREKIGFEKIIREPRLSGGW